MTYDSYDYLASRVPFPMVDSLIVHGWILRFEFKFSDVFIEAVFKEETQHDHFEYPQHILNKTTF